MRIAILALCGFVLALLGGIGGASACSGDPERPYWRPCADSRDYDPPRHRPCPDCRHYPQPRPCPNCDGYRPYPEPRPCPRCDFYPPRPEPRPCERCDYYPAPREPRPCGRCAERRRHSHPRPCGTCGHYPPYPPAEPYPDTPRCTQKVPPVDPEFGGSFATVREGYLSVIGARGKEICHFFRGDRIYIPNWSCRGDICSIRIRQSSFPVEVSTSTIDLYAR